MIYVDSSVVLAELLSEDRLPLPEFWTGPLTSSRLLEFEVWNRLHARHLRTPHAIDARALLGNVAMIDLSVATLARALEPFPVQVRTLDGLHLATIGYLRANGQDVELATYDRKFAAAARALGVSLLTL